MVAILVGFLTGLGLGLLWAQAVAKDWYLAQRTERELELESELKWTKARVLALESDYQRAQEKWLWKE